MSLEELVEKGNQTSELNYWKERSASEAGVTNKSDNKPELYFGGKLFDALFGSNKIKIRPQGSANLILGIKTNKVDNPTIPENLRKTTTLDFEEKIQMNVSGSIGERLKLDINYNTEATFDYENQIKLNYEGKEDEIVKSIEAGNVSLPLSGTLINGGQNLFGFKTALQFGRLTVTSVFSQQKGESSVVRMEKGAQKQEFEISVDKYESNRHFFLSHYFRKNYDKALNDLPIINSDINIVKVEVWITNKTSKFEKARNIVAFTDLGEGAGDIHNSMWHYNPSEGVYPGNDINSLYEEMQSNYSSVRDINQVTSVFGSISGFIPSKDYEKVENARMLNSDEYSVNNKLGYISLNRPLNSDEVLAVAYEYTVRGKVFKVGEFSSNGPVAPNSLFLKLLKGTNLSPSMPQWDLMMKNIYNIGAYRVNPEDFVLNILYRNDKAGTDVNYLPAGNIDGEILLKVLNLDNLNTQLDPHPDGLFDFIDGITIISNKGRIVFPVVEPFGSYLRSKIGNNAEADKYVFEELYSKTQSNAKQLAEKNKFLLKGNYKSSANNEIDLRTPDIAKGAVKVVAGSRELVENIDYTVDYALGKVKIINQAILESGTPIQISSESNSMFDIQTKTLIGTHLDYKISDEFNLGATILHMSERPLTQKVNIGDEPICNTIWGVNGSYSSESEFLTRMVDKIPFINTKAKSRITVDAEFAQFLPGHNSGIGKEGNAYIDDFEGSKISIDLKAVSQWKLASTPQDNLFPEGKLIDDIKYGYNRAKIAWYIVDPLFYRKSGSMPSHIKADAEQRSNHFTREIKQTEVYPNKDIPIGNANIIAALNVAYYPQERGPYNFDVESTDISSGIDSEGKLKNPETRWGGIMRQIQTNDFEAANIQYIEFWMLDPFVYNEAHSGGSLYFDLGNISEDILRDSRKSFENGMPVNEEVVRLDTTNWGVVPLVQASVDGFNNNIQSRRKQDLGLDGLNSEDERSFFNKYIERIKNAPDLGELSKAYAMATEDPAGDDYHYFRGADYDSKRLSVLERYKRYNNPEGNSPTAEMSPESYPTSATSLPDNEDINRDNTLSETESFYRYKINLNPQGMNIGENFISDMRIAKVDLPNGKSEDVKWYQFKIPLTEFTSKYGNIEDFKSIRFVRMLLKGFKDSVVLRMASLDLVRDNWRKYDLPLNELNVENEDTKFDMSAVNIEENSEKTPVNYVLPPGIDRVLDASNPQLRQLNEQSLVLKVIDLHDGDARAIFKSVGMDMLRYKRLKMDVHAEKIENESNLEDNDLHVFIRIGTDYKNNYYEYEVPLKLTPPGYYPSIEEGRRAVWPLENQINFPLEYFQKVKLKRNDEIRKLGSDVNYSTNYTVSVGELENSYEVEGADNIVRIVGNPTLGDIRTVMIGIRNPLVSEGNIHDDGLPKSTEVWVNELRLSDFDEKGGWAANVRMTARMADFATVTLAGSKIAPGFGNIDQRVSQINRDDQFQYDFSTNVELGKFFPDKWNVRIPMYYAVSSQTIKPEYDPVDTDIPLKVKLKNEPDSRKRDSIRRVAEDYVHRKSINFTNVGVQDNDGKSSLIDISNLTLTYSYTENEGRDVKTVRDVEKNYRGLVNYTYNGRPKLYEPFKKNGFLKSKYLRLLKDFNFYLMPSQLSIRSDISRRYHEIVGRNLDNPQLKIEPTYDKEFLWNRYYDLRFNLTKNLKFDFSATAVARIDETEGMVDKDRDIDRYDRWRDTVWNSILEGGRTVQYHHNFSVTYRLPINKIPLLNWTNSNVRYAGNYDWQAGAITDEDINLGNEIRNSNTVQLNTQLNLTSLYNKVKFLKKINRNNSRYKRRGRIKQVKYEKVVGDIYKSKPLFVNHSLKTKDVKVRLISSKGRLVKSRVVPVTKNKVKVFALEDIKGAKVIVRGRVVNESSKFVGSLEKLAGMILSVKNVSLSYSENNATTLPGYLPEVGYFGTDNYNGFSAPGFGFIAGLQDEDFVRKAAQKGWITKNTKLNSPYIMTTNSVFSGRAVIEPIRGLRINLTARRAKSSNNSEYINYNEINNEFTIDNRSERGNFSMTYIGLKSSFFTINGSGNYFSKAYDKFLNNRKNESRRMAIWRYGDVFEQYAIKDGKGIPTGYYEGYGPNSQEVLIPSFLSAYGLGNSKSLFPGLSSLRPNWNISFVGLRKLPFFKRLFKTLNLNHAYSCTYNIGSFISNLDYVENPNSINLSGNFLSEYDVNTVSITEQFNPLINVDMVWRNNFTTSFEISRKRNLALSLSNSQLSENTSNEVVFGCGYRFNQLPLIIGKKKELRNDFNVRCDFSIRKNNTVIRKINEYVDQLTAGQKVMSLKISGDYTLNNRFNLRVFYDKVVNTPYVSLAYPTTNANFGLSVRFTLAQ
jgi:cell surface protein SprA